MNAIVIEHVKIEELPQAWRAKLAKSAATRVTGAYRGGSESSSRRDSGAKVQTPVEAIDDPLFGMWADREDMADAPAYIREIRAGRFNRDGSRTDESGTDTGAQG